MAVQYCNYADIVGGSEKVQNYADVKHEWSLANVSIKQQLFLPNPAL